MYSLFLEHTLCPSGVTHLDVLQLHAFKLSRLSSPSFSLSHFHDFDLPPYTPSPPTAHMPPSVPASDEMQGPPSTGKIGTLLKSEVWWRDHYRDIEINGYRLRSRYDPDWQPSWRASGKDFFSAEDGQPTIVSSIEFATLWVRLRLDRQEL